VVHHVHHVPLVPNKHQLVPQYVLLVTRVTTKPTLAKRIVIHVQLVCTKTLVVKHHAIHASKAVMKMALALLNVKHAHLVHTNKKPNPQHVTDVPTTPTHCPVPPHVPIVSPVPMLMIQVTLHADHAPLVIT